MSTFTHLLTQTCSVSRSTGVDAYGDSAFGAIETLRCAHSTGRSVVRGADGFERVSNDVLALAGLGPRGSIAPITPTDRVWLPGVATTSTPKTPIAIRGEPSRRSGVFLWQAFF